MIRITCNCLASTSKSISSLPNIRSFSSSNLMNSTPSPATPSSTPSTPTSSKASVSTIPLSSVPAGTVLKGLNFLKTSSDPIALEDSEYPAWLFELVAPPAKSKGVTEEQRLKKEGRELKKGRTVGIKAANNLKSR